MDLAYSLELKIVILSVLTMKLPEPYPLTWPAWQPRATSTTRSQFDKDLTIRVARDELLLEMGRFGASRIVISSNLRVQKDGLPYARQTDIKDVAIAVYAVKAGVAYCFACDRWDKVQHNMRAIAKHIEAIRGQARWGVGTIEQAFAGYQLPSGQERSETCWEILGVRPCASRDEVRAAYRELSKTAHPDVGGDRVNWDRLHAAMVRALRDDPHRP